MFISQKSAVASKNGFKNKMTKIQITMSEEQAVSIMRDLSEKLPFFSVECGSCLYCFLDLLNYVSGRGIKIPDYDCYNSSIKIERIEE